MTTLFLGCQSCQQIAASNKAASQKKKEALKLAQYAADLIRAK